MRRLSSSLTGFHKWVVPVFMAIGLVSLWLGLGISVAWGQMPLEALLFPPDATVFFYLLWRRMLAPLLDEVWLDGTDFIVRNGQWEERIPIHEVSQVEALFFFNPERIVLTLREPCPFGEKVVFLPPIRVFRTPFSPHPLAAELDEMVRNVDGRK
jgi:hypothetical protein